MTVFRQNGATIFTSANTTSQNNALVGAGGYLKVSNQGAAACLFVRSGQGAQTATTSDLPIAPGEQAILKIDLADDNFAIITHASSCNVAISRGEI